MREVPVSGHGGEGYLIVGASQVYERLIIGKNTWYWTEEGGAECSEGGGSEAGPTISTQPHVYIQALRTSVSPLLDSDHDLVWTGPTGPPDPSCTPPTADQLCWHVIAFLTDVMQLVTARGGTPVPGQVCCTCYCTARQLGAAP
jgi:hypothetical protein